MNFHLRDFPSWRDFGKSRQELLEKREPEVSIFFKTNKLQIVPFLQTTVSIFPFLKQTAALMKMILDHPWALSASFHTGSLTIDIKIETLTMSAALLVFIQFT